VFSAACQHEGPSEVPRNAEFLLLFHPGAAGILKPLTNALHGGRKMELQWTDEMTAAFENSKMALQRMLELAHPVAGAQLVLGVDASDTLFNSAWGHVDLSSLGVSFLRSWRSRSRSIRLSTESCWLWSWL